MTKPRASDIDMRLGTRIRERRVVLGFTIPQLADLVGISHQQIAKYEHGINRISVGRLIHIALALKTSAASFLEGLDSAEVVTESSRSSRLNLAHFRAFAAIPDHAMKRRIHDLTRALANGAGHE